MVSMLSIKTSFQVQKKNLLFSIRHHEQIVEIDQSFHYASKSLKVLTRSIQILLSFLMCRFCLQAAMTCKSMQVCTCVYICPCDNKTASFAAGYTWRPHSAVPDNSHKIACICIRLNTKGFLVSFKLFCKLEFRGLFSLSYCCVQCSRRVIP